jgi:hypothetical protein
MKNTLLILAVSAIFGALLMGCSPAAEGNTTTGTATNSPESKPTTGTPSATEGAANTSTPEMNAPATNEPKK